MSLQFTSTLRFRLTLAFTLLIAACAGGLGFVVYHYGTMNLLELHQQTGSMLARNIARSTELNVIAENSQRLERTLAQLEMEPFVRYATVFHADGRVLSLWCDPQMKAPQSALQPSNSTNLSVRDLVVDGEPVTEFDWPIFTRAHWSYGDRAAETDPFSDGDAAAAAADEAAASRVIGSVRVGLSREPLFEQLASARDRMIRLVFTAILLGAAAAVLLVRGFLRPITRIIEATRVIGRGDFDGVVAHLPREGELAALSHALTRMTRQLRDAKQQLVEANTHLEQKVEERTSALQKALTELKVLDRMKDEFLSSVSHEFRTPLTSIRAGAEILLQFPDEPPETRAEFLMQVLTECERLNRLVNDILDLVKLESGDLDWKIQKIDLLEVAEDALKKLRPVLDEHQLRGFITRREPVPAVRGDRARIQQVLTNLLSNAIKFSHEGGTVEVCARTVGDTIEVQVIDQGIGIAKGDQEQIFDRFKQVGDTLTEKPPGTGLGLPICRNIVQRHGGRVWVESSLGRGSAFHFTLPIDGPDDRTLRRPLTAAVRAHGQPTSIAHAAPVGAH